MSSVPLDAHPSSSPPSSTRAGLVGPVLGWEMLRLGRRGSTIWLRVLMALALLAALWAVYLNQFPADATYTRNNAQIATDLSRFTQSFAYVYLMMQLIVICVLAPLFVVGAMGEERDRKTLEFLLATDLSNWEILVGKLGSRMVQLLGLMAAGLPLIALTSVWGGVEPSLLLSGYGISFMTVFAVTGMCAACAAIPGSLRAAALRSFAVVLAVYGLLFDLSPFVALRETFRRSNTIMQGDPAFMLGAWQYFKWQFFLGISGILLARYWLRRLAFAESGRKSRPTRSAAVQDAQPVPSVARTEAASVLMGGWGAGELVASEPPRREKRHWADPPPLGDRPLYWKEVYFSGSMNRIAKLLSLVPTWMWILIGMTLSVMMLTAEETADMKEVSNVYARVLSLIFLFFTCLTVGLSAAGSVSRERQNLTMIDLLMIPRPRHHLLMAKWFASMRKGVGIGAALLAVLMGAVIVYFALGGGISPLAVMLMIPAVLVYAAFSASLGLFLSVRCSTVLRASCWWLALVLLILGGTFVLIESQMSSRERSNPWMMGDPDRIATATLDRVINPIYTWNQLGFATGSLELLDDLDRLGYRYPSRYRWGQVNSLSQLIPALCGLLFYLTLAWLFWWLALASFEREGQLVR